MAMDANQLTRKAVPEPNVSSGNAERNLSLSSGTDNTNRLVNVNTANLNSVGVFTTGQSLVTFPGAVAAVTTIWNVLAIWPQFGREVKVVPIVLSLIIGFFIYLLSASSSTTWRDKLADFGIALINSFIIAAAALGLNPK